VGVALTITMLIMKNRRSKVRDFRSRVEKFRDDINGWYNQLQRVAAKLEASLPVWNWDRVQGYIEALKEVQGSRYFMPYCDKFYQELLGYQGEFPTVAEGLGQLRLLYEQFPFSVLKYKEEADLTKIIRENLEPSEVLFFDDVLRVGSTERALGQLHQQMEHTAQLQERIFDSATNVATSMR
jgi:hypothetical protein